MLALVLMTGTAVYAESATGGMLSKIEFSALPENHGVPQRVIEQKYDAYRQGRLPVTTLEASSIR